MKICLNDCGHMTKMATMPIYGKNLKKSSSPEPMIYPCKFGDIPSIGSGDIMGYKNLSRRCRKFISLRPPVTLKVGSESPKCNQLFSLSQ